MFYVHHHKLFSSKTWSNDFNLTPHQYIVDLGYEHLDLYIGIASFSKSVLNTKGENSVIQKNKYAVLKCNFKRVMWFYL